MPLTKYDHVITFNPKPLSLLTSHSQQPLVEESVRSCEDAGIAEITCGDALEEEEIWICDDFESTPSRMFKGYNQFESSKVVHRMGEAGLYSFCQQFSIVADQSVEYLNAHIDLNFCRELRFGYLEAVILNRVNGLYKLIVHTSSNNLNTIDGTFQFEMSNMNTHSVLSMRMIRIKQLTRFRKHQQCSPLHANPEFCFCGT
jgi:hypothetical protein